MLVLYCFFNGSLTVQIISLMLKITKFVPTGMLATVGALAYGFYGFQTGNQRLQQVMMRTRVVAQGATVLFLVGGIAMATLKSGQTK